MRRWQTQINLVCLLAFTIFVDVAGKNKDQAE